LKSPTAEKGASSASGRPPAGNESGAQASPEQTEKARSDNWTAPGKAVVAATFFPSTQPTKNREQAKGRAGKRGSPKAKSPPNANQLKTNNAKKSGERVRANRRSNSNPGG